jgi:hypothetical protein
VVFYDALVAGKVFQVGDVLKEGTSGEMGRVIAVIEDTSSTGKVILAGKTGAFTDTETIQRLLSDDSYENVADVNGTADYLDAADMNIPAANPVISEQRASEGGIYGSGSLNIVRDMVEVASFGMDTMDELLQLDDKSIVDGQVKNQLYRIKEDWRGPDLTWRFVENGGVQDESRNNIFTNVQSAGSLYGVGNHGFFLDSTNPSPPSSIYLEQDGTLLPRSWLAGHTNVLVKKRTKTHPKCMNPTVEGLGQLINSGDVTAHCRMCRNESAE